MLNDTFEATKTREELRIGRTFGRLARGTARWGKDAIDTGLEAVGARRALVAADLAAATGHAAPRTRVFRGLTRAGAGQIISGSVGMIHPLRRSWVEHGEDSFILSDR